MKNIAHGKTKHDTKLEILWKSYLGKGLFIGYGKKGILDYVTNGHEAEPSKLLTHVSATKRWRMENLFDGDRFDFGAIATSVSEIVSPLPGRVSSWTIRLFYSRAIKRVTRKTVPALPGNFPMVTRKVRPERIPKLSVHLTCPILSSIWSR